MSEYYENLDDFEYRHENDNNLGWEYRDEPYGGFLVVDETECYIHNEAGREIEVRLGVCVEFINLEDACGEPGFLVEANLVVHPDSLSESSIEDVAGSCGWFNDDGEPVLDYYSVASYGYSAPIDNVWGADSWQEGWEEIRAGAAFAGFASGFSLDRPWNRMGTTGWDVIEDAVLDENAFEKSAKRLKDQYEEAA